MRREKLKAKTNEFLNKEKERLAKWRANMKQDQKRYDKFKENDKLRKCAAKKNKEEEVIVTEAVNVEVRVQEETSMQTLGPAFSSRQTLHRRLSTADSHLPKSPHKKAEIMQRLATKYKLRIIFQQNRRRPRKELNEEEKIWLIEFLNRFNISYTNPGSKDHVYIGKIDGKSKYKQKQ